MVRFPKRWLSTVGRLHTQWRRAAVAGEALLEYYEQVRPEGKGPIMQTILLVDCNALLRQGLRSLLSSSGEFEVIGEAGDSVQATQLALSNPPDLLLIDSRLPGSNGLQVAAQLKRRLPRMRVIVLTETKTSDSVRESLLAGADGYVLKSATFAELLIALRCVAQGKKFLSPDVSGPLVHRVLHPSQRSTKDSASGTSRLTQRERCILQLVAEGRTNRAVAEFLSVSPKTVEKHRASVMRKLALRNAAELMFAAMDMGLVERPVLGHARVMEPKPRPHLPPFAEARGGLA